MSTLWSRTRRHPTSRARRLAPPTHEDRRSRRRLLSRPALPTLALAGLLLALSLAWVASARAGTYTVYSCRSPEPARGGLDGWRFGAQNPALDHWSNGCPARPLSLSLGRGHAHAAGEAVSTTFDAPADTTIAGYRLYRWAQVAPSTPYHYAQQELRASGAQTQDRCMGTEQCAGLGHVGLPALFAHDTTSSGLQQLRLAVGCLSSGCPAITGPEAELSLARADITLADNSAPVITAPPSGPLVSAQRPLAGVQSVSIAASDRGAGVYRVALEIDGNVELSATIDDNDGQCRTPFVRVVPCPLNAGTTVDFDTSTLADGPHQLRVLVSDAANNTTPWGPMGFVSDNASCDTEPATTEMKLTAGLVDGRHGGRSRKTMTVDYSAGATVTGAVLQADGTPIADAAVCVVAENDAPGAPRSVEGTVLTDEMGRFTAKLPKGPSRTVSLVYRSPAGSAVSSSVQLKVRPVVSVRAPRQWLRNGQRLLLHGRISRPVPRRGVVVTVYARRSRHWQQFASGRARSDGRFTIAYQFTRTAGRVRYRLRAAVPEQPAYPFASGSSPPFAVRVRG